MPITYLQSPDYTHTHAHPHAHKQRKKEKIIIKVIIIDKIIISSLLSLSLLQKEELQICRSTVLLYNSNKTKQCMVFYMLCKYLQHVVGRFLRITFSCALLGALSTIPVPGAFEEWRRFPRDYQPRPASSSPDSLSLVPTDSCHRPVETIPYRCPAGYRRFCLLKASHLICTKTGNVASRPNSHYAPRRCASRTQVTLSVHSSLLRDSSESQGRTRTCTHGICTRVR